MVRFHHQSLFALAFQVGVKHGGSSAYIRLFLFQIDGSRVQSCSSSIAIVFAASRFLG